MWEVFLSPHTDDETIGMAGAIARARLAGRDVLVILVTDNAPSPRGFWLFPGQNVAAERRKEWQRALHTLDVVHQVEWNLSEADMNARPFAMQTELERRIDELNERYDVVHFHTVWGLYDINALSGFGSLAHGLCSNALIRFAMRTRKRSTIHGVYLYSFPLCDRHAPQIRTLTMEEFQLKRAALDCYRPGPDSIGYGYRSVPELIDGASLDPREFSWEVTSA